MLDGKILIVLLIDYVILYSGCTYDNLIFELIGGLMLLVIAIITVIPIEKKQGGGKNDREITY